MKKIFILLIVISIALTSCLNIEDNRIEKKPTYEIIIIDSCEYIVKYKGVPEWEQTFHKGNCKHCSKH